LKKEDILRSKSVIQPVNLGNKVKLGEEERERERENFLDNRYISYFLILLHACTKNLEDFD